MNDLLYYEPLADLLEDNATYRQSPTQVRFGYLTLAALFHWNLLKLLGEVSPTYRLAPPAAEDGSTLAQLPYLDGIVFKTIPDDSTRNAALASGEIDMLLTTRRAGGGLIDPLSPESPPLRGPYPRTCRVLRSFPPPAGQRGTCRPFRPRVSWLEEVWGPAERRRSAAALPRQWARRRGCRFEL